MKFIKILFLIMIILISYVSYNNTEEFTILDIGLHNFDTYEEAKRHNDRSDKYVLAKIIDSNLNFISEEDNNNLKNKDLILTLSFLPNEGNETIINSGTSESSDNYRLTREDNIFCKEYLPENVKKWYICGAHITNVQASIPSNLLTIINIFFSNASSFIPSESFNKLGIEKKEFFNCGNLASHDDNRIWNSQSSPGEYSNLCGYRGGETSIYYIYPLDDYLIIRNQTSYIKIKLIKYVIDDNSQITHSNIKITKEKIKKYIYSQFLQ